MNTKDLVGIGIGPFNLSIAALCHDSPKLDVAFYDKKSSFCWVGITSSGSSASSLSASSIS